MLMVKNTIISIKSQSRAMVTKSKSTNKSNFESKVSIFHIVLIEKYITYNRHLIIHLFINSLYTKKKYEFLT